MLGDTFQHKNIGIFGRSGCGKTTILKHILTQSIQIGNKVVGISLQSLLNDVSELGHWTSQYPCGIRTIAGCINDSSLNASPVFIEVPAFLTLEKQKTSYEFALEHAISLVKSVERSTLYIDEVSLLLRSSRAAQILENLITDKVVGVQVIIVSQSVFQLSESSLNNLDVKLFGEISPHEVYQIEKQLQYPDSVIKQLLTGFPYPRKKTYRLWIVDQSKNMPAIERFTNYKHPFPRLHLLQKSSS